MDANNQPVVLSKQPLFVGCNEEKLLNIIIDKVNDHNKLIPDGEPQVEVAIMSANMFISSTLEWRDKQPEYIESIIGKDMLSEEMLSARYKCLTALDSLGLRNFTSEEFNKRFKEVTKKTISAKQREDNLVHMVNLGVIMQTNIDDKPTMSKRQFKFILTPQEIKDIHMNRIRERMFAITKIQSEIAAINEQIIADELTTTEIDDQEEGDMNTSTDHLNDRDGR
jgi:hypothetical protein